MIRVLRSKSTWAAAGVVVALSGCAALPASGPSAGNVVSMGASQLNENEVQVLDLTEALTNNLLKNEKQALFSETWKESTVSGTVGLGDVVEVQIWEAPPAVLFGQTLGSMGSGAAHQVKLPLQLVDKSGLITVPFAGSIKVRGLTTLQIQNEIAARLKDKANQPQVMVSVVKNNSSNVTVIREGNSINLPLTSKGERVLDAISAVGGSPFPANKTTLQLTRADKVRSLPLMQVTQDGRQNILLQPGDVVTAMSQPLSFTAFGAAGKNGEFNFESQGISLAQALGRVGGLRNDLADANGLFIFRYENPEILDLRENTPAQGLNMKVPVVYRVNLKDANSLFYVQNFPVHDKDVLYVANAPLADLQKFLSLISTSTSLLYTGVRAFDILK